MSVYYNGKFADIPPEKSDCGKKTDDLKKLIENIIGKNPDSDRLLIIALIFLLAGEGADKKLLLALGYILL
ncbi:MAG: hypothetical protein K2J08_09375 [Ruminococcus sp.]|nr:hypothetical protein [Ruminococcus sp.]